MIIRSFARSMASLAIVLTCCVNAWSQENVHPQSTEYVWPEDPLVKERLEQWRDQKFGMIIHWGVYAVPGMIESWALSGEPWVKRDTTKSYEEFKKWYWDLSKEFNPVKFDPDQWASAAKSAGMRYVVFTTKHHDGFNMFDTKYSDYKISSGPFRSHPKSNVALHVFDSFRKQNFMIGAYFSKPDWHSEYFWWPYYATSDRNVNYDIRKYPWRWNQFRQYTFNQIHELMTEYGKMDILWLDGGWVRPLETVTEEVRSWGAAIPPFSQSVDMDAIAADARKAQPGILVVDRTVHGPYENYQTPEQRIPDYQLQAPWESCITLGDTWGYAPNDKFKSPTTVIHMLVEVVAKGGSMLLGVGPSPEGLLTEDQTSRLNAIGQWLSVNGKCIYNTRPVVHYVSGNTWFTGNKDGTINAIVLMDESEKVTDGNKVPVGNKRSTATVEWKGNIPRGKMTMLSTGRSVRYKITGDTVTVTLPSNGLDTSAALAFQYALSN
ncbi:alpha-L-fucosidase [Chryseolinea sp. T2]|uniref:alpha-L-fucosidase n=1 Tax=Chryseolinea sp. T2 TaxID=3129255 RepID=UPI0030776267